MKDVFVSKPFRVVSVGQTKLDNAAYLMIMSSSPGILNGDRYHVTIHVEENARLQMQSQSYQRLYNMGIDGDASQQMQIKLAKNSAFTFVPHPVVPHENSRFKSSNKVTLSEGCEFMMSEIITCGRKHHGEMFKFSYFQNMTEVRYNEKLILKDNMLLRPDSMPILSMGQLENFTHQGTLMYVNTTGLSPEALITHFINMMELEVDMEFGISALQCDGFVLRCLGNGAEQMYNVFRRIQQFIWEENK